MSERDDGREAADPAVGGRDDGGASAASAPPSSATGTPAPVAVPAPLRSPLALAGAGLAGFVIGLAEVVPGFSGGTVALVVGIYERLVAAIRQGARVLSLLLRGHATAALAALRAMDLLFVGLLAVGMLLAVLTLAGALEQLITDRPVELSAVLLGLVLGAAVVAGRQLRAPRWWHPWVVLLTGVAFFVLLGWSPGTIEDPSPLALLLGAGVAVCAWILPGVSGSFVLLMLGLWPAVIGVLADRDVGGILVVAAGCVTGLALFSTLLHWLLLRVHDLVLAVLIGLMLGSVRVLWPWPADDGLGSAALGAPPGSEALLALALALAAFGMVWMAGLAAAAVERRLSRSEAGPPR